jgi:hypothetical protein
MIRIIVFSIKWFWEHDPTVPIIFVGVVGIIIKIAFGL